MTIQLFSSRAKDLLSRKRQHHARTTHSHSTTTPQSWKLNAPFIGLNSCLGIPTSTLRHGFSCTRTVGPERQLCLHCHQIRERGQSTNQDVQICFASEFCSNYRYASLTVSFQFWFQTHDLSSTVRAKTYKRPQQFPNVTVLQSVPIHASQLA